MHVRRERLREIECIWVHCGRQKKGSVAKAYKKKYGITNVKKGAFYVLTIFLGRGNMGNLVEVCN